MIPYERSYRGGRFFKCDLHMHTPADPGWKDATVTGTDAAAAEAYIRRCYEVGLEAIGVADHNFASREFIPLLRTAAIGLAADFGYEITIFPGFEFTADVGRGVHVLALFGPDADLEALDHLLTECGIGMPRFEGGQPARSTKRLPEILGIVQRKDGQGVQQGILILPHCMGNEGMFDNDRTAHWLQAEEFKNPELYCVEVPRPVETLNQGFQRLLRNGDDCDRQWRRPRPVACIMSSDARALRATPGVNNVIDFRYSWIKMSRPSVEALRQSFLDPDSRIRLQPERPETGYRYPMIRRLAVTDAAFLADQTIDFSANLNTLIGGRGTGKSTIIEYLRVVTGEETDIRGEEARKNFAKLRQTIRGTTNLEMVFEKEGQLFESESRGGQPAVVKTEGAPDLSRFFPVRVLSQKEVYAIAEDPDARRRLVDDVVRRELDEAHRREATVIREIRSINEQISGLPDLREQLKILETERKDLQVRLARLQELEEPLAAWKGWLAEEAFFARLAEEAEAFAQTLESSLDEIQWTATTIGSELRSAPNAALVATIAERAEEALTSLKASVRDAVGRFHAEAAALLADDAVARWRTEFEAQRAGYEKRKDELAAQGTDPDQYLAYQRDLRDHDVQIEALSRRFGAVEALRRKRDGDDQSRGLIADLREVWNEETRVRGQAAAVLNASVPRTVTNEPFVRVSVLQFAEVGAFLAKMREEIRDARRISAEDWDQFMRAVFETTTHGAQAPRPAPVEELATWLGVLSEGAQPTGCPWSPGDRRVRVLLEWLNPTRLAELRLWRTPDKVEVELFRHDGTLAGTLDGALSIGQRVTAVLALLLASDDVPIVIDQPEEDLDNEFIFSELVPLLRKVKERRQVILASHNANIPVNGDSELFVALKTRQRGNRAEGVERAVGALDQHQVKRAVEDIMEGSEEAFRRRFHKYGF